MAANCRDGAIHEARASDLDRCYDSLVRWAQASVDDDDDERSVPALIQLLRHGHYQQMAGTTSRRAPSCSL